MFILYSSNLRAQVADHGNSVQLMSAAIGERPELLGWALKHLATDRLVSVAYPGIFFGEGGCSTNSVEDRENRDLEAVAP